MEVELLGDQSVFSIFFVDESLTCSSPIEKHLYEIIAPSLTISAPCYYCGETDLARTSEKSDQSYPICHHCSTVRKLGPVKKRKKRAIVPRKSKSKNKKSDRIGEVELLQDISEDDLDGSQRMKSLMIMWKKLTLATKKVLMIL